MERIKYLTSPEILNRSEPLILPVVDDSPGDNANDRLDAKPVDLMAKIDRQGFRYEFEERAAILEYEGGLSRNQAEQRAIDEITQRMKR